MRSAFSPRSRAFLRGGGGAVAVALLLTLTGVGAALPAGGNHPTAAGVVTPSGGFTQGNSPNFFGRVTWNHVNPVNDTSTSNALPIHLSGNITVQYAWQAVPSTLLPLAPTYTVYDARLQIFFFGLPLASRDVDVSGAIASTGGVINLSWDPTIYGYILAGAYAITTSLLTPNGTTLWSENFLVDASAPFAVGAALPLALVVILIVELYFVATAGREALHEPFKSKKGKGKSDVDDTAGAPPASTPTDTVGGGKSP